MAAGIIYLDVDDEITSAAARIRTTDANRVAVVLPYGSRVATSRINFRLLARDALTNGKRLSIVAGDAATRALAASAGLPIFSTVGEYESSLPEAAGGTPVAPSGGEEPMLVSETVATPASPGAPRRGRRARETSVADGVGTTAAAGAAAGAPTGDAAGTTVADGTTGAAGITDAPGASRPATSTPTEMTAATGPAARLGAGTATPAMPAMVAAAAPSSGSPAPDARPRGRNPATIPAARVMADTPSSLPGQAVWPRPDVGRRPSRLSIGRTPLVIGLAVLALAVVVGGAAAFLFLPTATAVIAPREETIGPLPLRIVASTTATEPDPNGIPPVVPAQLLTIPLEVTDTFPATGKRIEETKARGAVRFDNLDPTSSNTIPKGSVVSTGSGIRFRTDSAVTVRPAELVGLTIVPSRASVKVTAVDAGPEGNVEPNSITTVPRGEEPFFLKVTNPNATRGGSRTEFPRVTQDDVDKAMAELTDRLTAAFDERLADPDLPGDTATVFPQTKIFIPPVYADDPASLVGQEVETFELSATASGTVVAVDTAPVQAVAEARIQSSVETGHVLVDGSGEVDTAPAEVADGVITFPVVVTARQVPVLDPVAIELEILGKPLDEARRILATYGEAELTVWPDWVGTIPTLDSRVEITTSGPPPSDTDSPSPGASS